MSPVGSRVQFVLLFMFGSFQSFQEYCIFLCFFPMPLYYGLTSHLYISLNIFDGFVISSRYGWRPRWHVLILLAQIACSLVMWWASLTASFFFCFCFFFADLFCETSSTFFLKVEVRANQVKHYVKLVAEPTQEACSKAACSLWTSSRWMFSNRAAPAMWSWSVGIRHCVSLCANPPDTLAKKKLVLSATSCREYQEVFKK